MESLEIQHEQKQAGPAADCPQMLHQATTAVSFVTFPLILGCISVIGKPIQRKQIHYLSKFFLPCNTFTYGKAIANIHSIMSEGYTNVIQGMESLPSFIHTVHTSEEKQLYVIHH